MAHFSGAANFRLRRLIALARDLLQAPDLRSVLELVGPTLQELAAPDAALLVARLAGHEYATAFDKRGLPMPPQRRGVLYEYAKRALEDQTPLMLPSLAAPDRTGTASLLALPFPPVNSMGVLAVLWNGARREEQCAELSSAVRYIAELTAAALGNVEHRVALGEQVSAQAEDLKEAAHEHAEELRRRDSVEEEFRLMAVTDVLTGMLNRRGFFVRAEQSFKIARRQGLAAAVISADIDGLKTVNDRLGHDVGDRLIQTCADILKRSFRDSDVVARLGGDEFAAFTLDSEQPEAILSRIRRNADAFHQASATPYRISFSTGIVQCDPSSELTLSDYLSMADERMFAQKKERHVRNGP